jgi:CheY-like chemotaxis protein
VRSLTNGTDEIPASCNARRAARCNPQPVSLRCLIVDDNGRFLDAARDLLEREGITVVAVASTSTEALRRVDDLRPDVVLVDIDLGEENGFDLARQLADAPDSEPSPVILISTYAERDFADLIAASPALGFLSKSDLSGHAIYEVLARAGGEDRDRRG